MMVVWRWRTREGKRWRTRENERLRVLVFFFLGNVLIIFVSKKFTSLDILLSLMTNYKFKIIQDKSENIEIIWKKKPIYLVIWDYIPYFFLFLIWGYLISLYSWSMSIEIGDAQWFWSSDIFKFGWDIKQRSSWRKCQKE